MIAFLARWTGGFLAALALAQPTLAQDKVLTLREMLALCKSTEAPNLSACSGFVTGVRHTLQLFKNSFKDQLGYCIPASVNNRDFRDGFVAWAERNPREHEFSAVRGVVKSALERYPCGKTAPKPFEF